MDDPAFWVSEQDRVAAGLEEPTHECEAFVLLTHDLLDPRVSEDDRRLAGKHLDQAQVAFPEPVATESAYSQYADDLSVGHQRGSHRRFGSASHPSAGILLHIRNEDRTSIACYPAGDAGICRNAGENAIRHVRLAGVP